MPPLTLTGCAPVPLAHYLKALGVFRLISTHSKGDDLASAAWRHDQLVLTSRFDAASLQQFFLHEYEPTPILAPWNGGSGFYKKDNDKAINAILGGKADRLRTFKACIDAAQKAVEGLELTEKPSDESKARLLQVCRNTLPEEGLSWLDAVYVLGQDGAKFPPLLGTGGNDGRLEFTNNFMQRITELMDVETGEPTPNAALWLGAALFGSAAPGSTAKAPIGQFYPGAAGGANATSGFDGPSAVNPWDFVLMIEGALLFAAASVKRLESTGDGVLVYPFCVRQTGVGYASASQADEKDARCEMWMPLWERAASLKELQAIFGEGRAQVAGRAAKNGIDFARAVVSLGVDRGITGFQRYGFQVRNGLAYFAIPLDRVTVQRNAHANLLNEFDSWHNQIRSKLDKAPASIVQKVNQLERKVLEFCRNDSLDSRTALLMSLGQAERALARTCFESPISGLSARWLDCDHSTEFRLAMSLAGLSAWLGTGEGKGRFWLRQQLEPVDIKSSKNRSWVSWLKNDSNDITWHDGDLTSCLNAILGRRIQRIAKAGAKGWPDSSPRPARLEDITAFIEGRTDDSLLADLLWGLSLLDWQAISSQQNSAWENVRSVDGEDRFDLQAEDGSENEGDPPSYNWKKDDMPSVIPSSFYGLLKLCFRKAETDERAIPLNPAIHQRASAGDGVAASSLAARRLRASGEAPLVTHISVSSAIARRTAAALLFPISRRDIRLLKLTLQHQTEDQNS